MNVEQPKTAYLFNGLIDDFLPEEMGKVIHSFIKTENLYLSATREITTKLEILNDEFKYLKDRNPIQLIKPRVKTPRSILEKLHKLGFELSAESARINLNDIAGVRVICSYIDDIYTIADLLTSQNDIELIRTRDYIKNPKSNGYRSLHLIITVPVFLSDRTEKVKVEVQIRTIAMDFWASLEHEIAYKLVNGNNEEIRKELRDCADVISDTDIRMQKLYNSIHAK
ncbi:MAG: GTP pyrophosphokinase family protein [Spirochaetes bacterium]|nr:GTP pyrophosphokinase family protein [Spirochaetota bacterium]